MDLYKYPGYEMGQGWAMKPGNLERGFWWTISKYWGEAPKIPLYLPQSPPSRFSGFIVHSWPVSYPGFLAMGSSQEPSHSSNSSSSAAAVVAAAAAVAAVAGKVELSWLIMRTQNMFGDLGPPSTSKVIAQGPWSLYQSLLKFPVAKLLDYSWVVKSTMIILFFKASHTFLWFTRLFIFLRIATRSLRGSPKSDQALLRLRAAIVALHTHVASNWATLKAWETRHGVSEDFGGTQLCGRLVGILCQVRLPDLHLSKGIAKDVPVKEGARKASEKDQCAAEAALGKGDAVPERSSKERKPLKRSHASTEDLTEEALFDDAPTAPDRRQAKRQRKTAPKSKAKGKSTTSKADAKIKLDDAADDVDAIEEKADLEPKEKKTQIDFLAMAQSEFTISNLGRGNKGQKLIAAQMNRIQKLDRDKYPNKPSVNATTFRIQVHHNEPGRVFLFNSHKFLCFVMTPYSDSKYMQ